MVGILITKEAEIIQIIHLWSLGERAITLKFRMEFLKH